MKMDYKRGILPVNAQRLNPFVQARAALRQIGGQSKWPSTRVKDHAQRATANFARNGLAWTGAKIKSALWTNFYVRLCAWRKRNLRNVAAKKRATGVGIFVLCADRIV
jgi:hypothetical protein